MEITNITATSAVKKSTRLNFLDFLIVVEVLL